MNERKIFVSDLDGTLLGDDASLTPLTTRVIRRLKEDGHVFTFSTARSISSAKEVAGHIRWLYPVMVYNGALIVDFSSPDGGLHVMDQKLLPAIVAEKVIRLGEELRLFPLLYMMDGDGREVVHYSSQLSVGIHRLLDARRGDPRFHSVDRLTVPPDYRAVLLNFMGEKQWLRPLFERLKREFKGMLSAELFPDTYDRNLLHLEVCHPEANKGDALVRWARLLAVSPRHVTAFGDNVNDVALFERAGMKIAVANAEEELKNMATDVIQSNADDGVARYIMDVLGYGVADFPEDDGLEISG